LACISTGLIGQSTPSSISRRLCLLLTKGGRTSSALGSRIKPHRSSSSWLGRYTTSGGGTSLFRESPEIGTYHTLRLMNATGRSTNRTCGNSLCGRQLVAVEYRTYGRERPQTMIPRSSGHNRSSRDGTGRRVNIQRGCRCNHVGTETFGGSSRCANTTAVRTFHHWWFHAHTRVALWLTESPSGGSSSVPVDSLTVRTRYVFDQQEQSKRIRRPRFFHITFL
jgi:hypothetical protein